jgi:FKBP-type peptidyl-prolyl cis-trans isomerase (trigger factor)
MIEENEAAYTWTVRHQIDNRLLETCTFKQDIPENMLESYYFQYQNYLNNAASASYMDLPTYMQRQYGATQDNYETMIHDFAKQGAQLGIIYQAIADEHELNPTAEEIQGAIGEYVKADTTGLKADDLDRFIKEYIRDELVSNRVRSWLYENCKVTEPEEDSEEKSDEDASVSETSEENTEDASAGNSSSDNADDNAENADTGSSAEDSGEGQTADSAAAHEN